MRTRAMKAAVLAMIMGLFIFAGTGRAQQEHPLKADIGGKAHAAVLEREIPKLMEAAGVPGMSIALISDGRVVWSRGFGVKNMKTGEPVDGRTVFEAASLTKPFFAFLAMKLVEAGSLDLDRPLITYAPEEFIAKIFVRHPLDREGFRRDRFAKITARMVLSHSSGLPHGEPRMPLPVLFEPGERFRYSAEGYEYLQRVVEHLSGKPLAESMREMVIEPLGMKESSMIWRSAYEAQAAVGHDTLGGTSGQSRKRTEAHAAASLYTTAADYARFVAALMNHEGLRKETVESMLAPQVEVKENVHWGLGFGLERTASGKAFWQWGDYGIFRNYIVAYPEQRIGVVYLTNSQNGLSIGQEVLDLAIGGGRDLGLVHLDYERHDSAAMKVTRTIRTQGTAEAVRLFREERARNAAAINERDLNNLGYVLINAGRAREAVEILKLNAEAFPGSANAWDSLAEAFMKAGDDAQAVTTYKKAIETAAHDRQADPSFLERLTAGARERVERLEARMRRRLESGEAEKRYSRLLGDWQFDIPGFGVLVLRVLVADGLLWGTAEGGVLGDRAEFIPVEGRPLEFKLDSSALGIFDWEFVADDKGTVARARFYLPSENIRAEGSRKL